MDTDAIIIDTLTTQIAGEILPQHALDLSAWYRQKGLWLAWSRYRDSVDYTDDDFFYCSLNDQGLHQIPKQHVVR